MGGTGLGVGAGVGGWVGLSVGPGVPMMHEHWNDVGIGVGCRTTDKEEKERSRRLFNNIEVQYRVQFILTSGVG